MQTKGYHLESCLIGEVIKEHKPLAYLISQSKRINAINALLQHILPENLHSHYQVLTIHQQTLIIQAENACWSTLLRGYTYQLLQSLRFYDQFQDIQKIRWKIQGSTLKPLSSPPTEERPALSSMASQCILNAARHIKHPLLKEKLEQLASRVY